MPRIGPASVANMRRCGEIGAMKLSDTAAQRRRPPRSPRRRMGELRGLRRSAAARDMQALVRHLHGFVTEVGLTEEEWREAIATLTATGHITDERRQEFILWSDALGVSMLVDALANLRRPGRPSRPCSARSTCPARRSAGTARTSRSSPPGPRPGSTGACLDLDGKPIAGAELDVWQNGDDKLYAVQARRPGGPPPRAVPHPRRRHLRVPRGSPGAVSDPRRRPGRPNAAPRPGATRGVRRTST